MYSIQQIISNTLVFTAIVLVTGAFIGGFALFLRRVERSEQEPPSRGDKQ